VEVVSLDRLLPSASCYGVIPKPINPL